MACDPAQDSAHLVQALAAVVSTCTNESNLAKVEYITITNAPASGPTNYATVVTNYATVVTNYATVVTNYATVVTDWLEPKSYTV